MRLAFITLLLLLAPRVVVAQTFNLERRAEAAPAGIAVPGATVAGAEEPAAMQANPAALGLVEGLTLQYLHEGHRGDGLGADGFWLATPLGSFVPALSMQWIRPREGGGARFRRTTVGLGFSGGRAFSLALAGNWHASPSRDLDHLWTLDAGLTVRPWRHLSIGAAILGINGELDGRRLPIQYDLGVATRLWQERLTLSADLLSDDRGRDELTVMAGALGLRAEVIPGLALSFQVQFPLRTGLSGPAAGTFGQLALTVDSAHVGVTGGGAGGGGAAGTWLVGARLSSERYRGVRIAGAPAPLIDLGRALERPRSLFAAGDPDPFRTLLRRIAEARDDAGVPALVVRIDDLPLGQGRVEELRRLLLEVAARKPLVAYLTGGGMKEYYLATAAAAVLAPPAVTLFPSGLASSSFFLRDALAKLGIGFDVVAVGRYKSAPDPLVRQDMSEGQREATGSILDDLFARQLRGIAAARGLSEGRVRELVDQGVFSAEEALAARLVDGIAWPDELERAASSRAGRKVRLSERWDASPPRAAQRWGPRRSVALVRVDGLITAGKSRADPLGGLSVAGAESVSRLLRQAASDREVVAIVLRVDSPGGDVLASDLIWRAVAHARRSGKPVVASMGDFAASGGYLVSVGADAIVAEPSTLTGSIGVFALKPDLSGLLGKIGVSHVTLQRGERADLRSVTRRWTDDERRLVERQVQSTYELFLARVAEGRRLPRDRVAAAAGGRVWTGAQAMERGLVDGLGSLEEAVRMAKTRAGYPADADLEVRPFEPERSRLGDLALSLASGGDSPIGAALARLPEVRAAALLLELGPLVALPPDWIGARVPESPGR